MLIGILVVFISAIFFASFALIISVKDFDLIGGRYKKGACTIGMTYNFEFINDTKDFTPKCNGYYKIEAWGADGGDTSKAAGGTGGYTSGLIYLDNTDTLVINVGEKGKNGNSTGTYFGGYNGGGNAYLNRSSCSQENGGGGGATDIRLEKDNLNSRIMVAGGGGGAWYNNCSSYDNATITGGAGGNLTGGTAVYLVKSDGFSELNPTGGTQTTGGQGVGGWQATSYTSSYIGSFGKGGTGADLYSGGGGGYYGGASGVAQPGAGGSSYISGYTGAVAVTSADDLSPRLDSNDNPCTDGTKDITCSYHYSNKAFYSPVMISGSEEVPSHKNTFGNGFVKITYLGTGTRVNYDQLACQTTIMQDTYSKLCKPSKFGFLFVNWTYNGEIVTNGMELPNEEEITLIATWKPGLEVGMAIEFDYNGTDSTNGSEQTFELPTSGVYKLEVWGAQGGSYDDTYQGGYGGYSVGEIRIDNTTTPILYINVGAAGVKVPNSGQTVDNSYNGGGGVPVTWGDNNEKRTSGGGATHIATVSGELYQLEEYKGTLSEDELYYISNEILIVAGGGGGAGVNSAIVSTAWSHGGSGGGSTGGIGSSCDKVAPTIATQTNSGVSDSTVGNVSNSAFGLGARTTTGLQSGGGGGFFGGGASFRNAGGGSGYIANPNLTNKAMYCYQCGEDLTNNNIKTIDTNGSNNLLNKTNCPIGYSENPISKCAKAGHGYVKITYLGE